MTPHQQPETRGRKRYGHPINIHPLCCKNCICFSVINQTNYCSSLDGVPRFISRSQIYFIERVGCASHTPAAPATEPKCDDCRFVKECSLLYFPPCEQLARNDERHYREKAKAERERVLDVLEEFLNSDDHLSLFKWEVREQIRSLRGGATEEGGERR